MSERGTPEVIAERIMMNQVMMLEDDVLAHARDGERSYILLAEIRKSRAALKSAIVEAIKKERGDE